MRSSAAGVPDASIRQIARDLNLSRNTVSRVLTEVTAQRNGVANAAPRRPSLLDPLETTIQELLGRYPNLTATRRCWKSCGDAASPAAGTIVRQRLGELRPRTAPLPQWFRLRRASGVQAQMDYAVYDLDFTCEGRRRVYLFSYVLGYSRRQYLRFVEAQDFPTTLREHHPRASSTWAASPLPVCTTTRRSSSAATTAMCRCTTLASWRSPRTTASGPWPAGRTGLRPRARWNGHSTTPRPACSTAAPSIRWNTSTRSPSGGWPRSPTCGSIARRSRRRWPCTSTSSPTSSLLPGAAPMTWHP